MPFDPITGVVGGLQFLTGLGQSIFSGRKKAERGLNNQIDKSPKVSANKSIMDYYNEALSRYNVNPQSSALYKRQTQNINRGVATGINALNDRRSGQAGISSILRGSNDAYLNAEVAAENEKSNRFGQLGNATGMKYSDDKYVFNQNEVVPFELKTQLAAMKLQGANKRANAGTQNMFGGVQTALTGYTPKKK